MIGSARKPARQARLLVSGGPALRTLIPALRFPPAILPYGLADLVLLVRCAPNNGPLVRTLAPPDWAGVAGAATAPRFVSRSAADLEPGAATSLIAALSQPLRRWGQRFVEPREYEVAHTSAALIGAARGAAELDALTGRLPAVVAAIMRPAQVLPGQRVPRALTREHAR